MQSHVVPAFVIRWLKSTSPGQLRGSPEFNRRVQDGPKFPWLCSDCEQLLCSWERPFAELFRYVHETSENQRPVSYGSWALKFAVSVSWRTLLLCLDQHPDHLAAEMSAIGAAEQRWRAFLLDQVPHPDRHEQHFIPVDAPVSSTSAVSPFLSRYFLRAVHSDVLIQSERCFTMTKLCRIVIVGQVREARRAVWSGSKLHVKEGTVCGTNISIPDALGRYWNTEANRIGARFSTLSEGQKEKIRQVTKSPDFQSTEVWRAIVADYDSSGTAAIDYAAMTVDGDE